MTVAAASPAVRAPAEPSFVLAAHAMSMPKVKAAKPSEEQYSIFPVQHRSRMTFGSFFAPAHSNAAATVEPMQTSPATAREQDNTRLALASARLSLAIVSKREEMSPYPSLPVAASVSATLSNTKQIRDAPGDLAGDSAQIGWLLARGEAMLGRGDIMAARHLFQRAADHGSARAATQVGKTFDPTFLDTQAVGLQPDTARAVAWYRRALALGDKEAMDLLRVLVADGQR